MSKGKISVRQTKDYDLIRQLRNEIFPEDKKELPLDDNDICWILWMESGKYMYPSGFAVLRPLSIDKEGGYAYMNMAGLVKSARGKGLHKKLINVRLNYCRRNNIKMVITYVVNDNLASANSLINKGFRLYEPEYAYAGKKGVIYLYYEFK